VRRKYVTVLKATFVAEVSIMSAAIPAPLAHDAASLMRRWFQEVWNEGNEATIEELFPADSVMWGVGRPDVSSRGPEEFRVFYQAMRKTFSDMRIELEGIVQGGDTAYTRFTVTATHSGEGLGMVPSGKTIKLVGMCALRAENGKIVEGWNVWDQMGLARELGVLSESALAIFPQRCKAENRNWELEKRTARRGDLACCAPTFFVACYS
jgi:predicted ester cyclase